VPDLNILVVDSSPTMQRIILNTLNRIGYENLTPAENGREALLIMKEQSFDLIITEWHMPEMDGLKLVQVLKNSEDYGHIPVVMVSSCSSLEDIMKAVNAGVDDYIVKPFSSETLKNKIDQVLSGL